MTLLGFVALLIIAAVAGSIGQAISGYSRGGCLVSAVIGFIGAWIGTWLSVQLGLPELLTINIQGEPFPVLWAIIGSALFTAVLGFLNRPRRAA
ncbi:MAG: hypothetical protein KJ063_04035 [Anaerolineae bacterium]|nr:hypothetical protein [Anaerolineae bacterium]